jgi:hypothetical protein
VGQSRLVTIGRIGTISTIDTIDTIDAIDTIGTIGPDGSDKSRWPRTVFLDHKTRWAGFEGFGGQEGLEMAGG